MDQKQFERLQSAVQWIADEQRRRREGKRAGTLRHNQSLWMSGILQDEWVAITECDDTTTHVPVSEMQLVCATSCCLAGDVVLAHGDRPVTFDGAGAVIVEYCVDDRGTLHTIPHRATQLLGINDHDAKRLFDGELTADDLVARATEIASDYGYELEII